MSLDSYSTWEGMVHNFPFLFLVSSVLLAGESNRPGQLIRLAGV